MPLYIVKSRGFYAGKLYDPDGKRQVLQTEKPFPKKKMPSWLELSNDGMTPQQRGAATKKAQRETEADEQSKIDIDEATFIDDNAVNANNVEKLG